MTLVSSADDTTVNRCSLFRQNSFLEEVTLLSRVFSLLPKVGHWQKGLLWVNPQKEFNLLVSPQFTQNTQLVTTPGVRRHVCSPRGHPALVRERRSQLPLQVLLK